VCRWPVHPLHERPEARSTAAAATRQRAPWCIGHHPNELGGGSQDWIDRDHKRFPLVDVCRRWCTGVVVGVDKKLVRRSMVPFDRSWSDLVAASQATLETTRRLRKP
jgi:hypothetical protein